MGSLAMTVSMDRSDLIVRNAKVTALQDDGTEASERCGGGEWSSWKIS
jgi:hypothetical protein